MRLFKIFNRKEKRSADRSWELLKPLMGGSPAPRQAEMVAAVVAAVDLISTSLASLTPRLYSEREGTRALLTDHSLAQLLRRPNRHQSWQDFMQWIMRQVLLQGNGISVYSDNQLIPIPYNNVSIQQASSGALVYTVTRPSLGSDVGTERYSDEQVLHVRAASDDGLIGISPLRRSSATVNLAQTINQAAQSMWQNGAYPSGALQLKSKLTPDARQEARTQLQEEFSGGRNYQRPLLLDNETTWQTISHKAKESQMVEQRDFAVVEVARIFGISPILLGDMRYGTYTNAATAARHLHQFVLNSWSKKFEQAFTNLLLPDTEFLELDQSDFTRGEAAERWQNHKIAIETGVLTPEEVKRMEGY